MPSRKRNKGKDRKARKAENKRVEIRNTWQGWVRGEFDSCTLNTQIIVQCNIQCNHGFADLIPDDDLIEEFYIFTL